MKEQTRSVNNSIFYCLNKQTRNDDSKWNELKKKVVYSYRTYEYVNALHRFQKFRNANIFNQGSFVIAWAKLNMSVYERMSLGHFMLCNIL